MRTSTPGHERCIFPCCVLICACTVDADSREFSRMQRLEQGAVDGEIVPVHEGDDLNIGPGNDTHGEGTTATERPTDQTNEAPCGSDTTIQYETESDSIVTICVFDNGAILVSESGPIGTPSALGKSYGSALDVFLETAPPEMPIPAALIETGVERDAAGTARGLDRPLTSAEGSPSGQGLDARFLNRNDPAAHHYCGSGGAAAFVDERCGWPFSNPDYSNCHPEFVGWHQFTCSNFGSPDVLVGPEWEDMSGVGRDSAAA
jgi:hypothetical protein